LSYSALIVRQIILVVQYLVKVHPTHLVYSEAGVGARAKTCALVALKRIGVDPPHRASMPDLCVRSRIDRRPSVGSGCQTRAAMDTSGSDP
jgi:hypothetical protein